MSDCVTHLLRSAECIWLRYDVDHMVLRVDMDGQLKALLPLLASRAVAGRCFLDHYLAAGLSPLIGQILGQLHFKGHCDN